MFGMGTGVATPRWPPGHHTRCVLVCVEWIWCAVLGRVREHAGGWFTTRLGAVRGGDVAITLRWLWIEFDRAIRTARLNGLPHVYPRPIDVMVYHGPQGDLVLRLVSRLDAFSGYPFRTWLPGDATGVTTGAPEVRPSRSSRTRESASQVSNTHSR